MARTLATLVLTFIRRLLERGSGMIVE